MPSPAARTSYRPDIDGLRAVAVLLVLGFHAFPQWLRGGFVGVDVFFVVSGFLITGILLGHLQAGDFTFRAFYAARIRRILPALLVVLIACLAIGWAVLLPHEYVQLGRHTAGSAGFVTNLLLWQEAGYFDTESQRKPLLHLWSLGVEEQFYLLWPVLLWASFRWRRSPGVVLLVLGGGSLIACLSTGTQHMAAAFFSPMTRFWELMAGAALAYWRQPGQDNLTLAQRGHPDWRHLASIVGLTLIVYAALRWHEGQIYPGWRAFFPILGALLLIAVGPDALVNRWLLARRLPVGIGLISYPLYLWHWPLLSFATIITAAPLDNRLAAALLCLSCLLATLTYYGIERPIRFGAWRQRTAMPGLLCLALLLMGCTGFAIVAGKGWSGRPVAVANTHYDVAQNDELAGHYASATCTPASGIVDPAVLANCNQFGSNTARRTIVIWGDSHAAAWAPVFYAIGRQLGDTRVVLLSFGGCPPVVGIRQSFISDFCSDINRNAAVLKAITALHPSDVVLIAFWARYINGPPRTDGGQPLPEESMLTTSPRGAATAATSRQALAAQLPATVAALAPATHVIVMKDVPLMNKMVNDIEVVHLPWAKPALAVEPTRAQHSERTAPAYAVIDTLAGLPHVTIFDPTPYLCDDIMCHSRRGAVIVYADNTHPSAAGALSFLPELLPLFPPLPATGN